MGGSWAPKFSPIIGNIMMKEKINSVLLRTLWFPHKFKKCVLFHLSFWACPEGPNVPRGSELQGSFRVSEWGERAPKTVLLEFKMCKKNFKAALKSYFRKVSKWKRSDETNISGNI